MENNKSEGLKKIVEPTVINLQTLLIFSINTTDCSLVFTLERSLLNAVKIKYAAMAPAASPIRSNSISYFTISPRWVNLKPFSYLSPYPKIQSKAE